MDRKITELGSIQSFEGNEYFVLASEQHNQNYKMKVSDFVDQVTFDEIDEELSLTSKNPVANKTITVEINKLDERIDELEQGGNGGDAIDLKISNVKTETLDAGNPARVEIKDLGTVNNTKSFAFTFGIPKGEKGEKGDKGEGGEGGEGYESFGYRTVFAFKHSVDRPATPVGGSWNAETNEITYPDGWSGSDALERPVWMSNATFDSEGIVTDWSVPFKISGDDGKPGEPGEPGSGGGGDGSDSDKAIEFIYKQSKDESDKPSKPNNDIYVDDYVPSSEGWDDHPQGVSSTITCEWICSRSYNKSTGVWNGWEGPVLWSKYGANGKDGDGVEYIYQLSSKYNRPATPGKTAATNSPTTNFQDREFIPLKGTNDEYPWSDNPSDVTADIPYQWVSIRKFNYDDQQWSNFEEPTLWAKYGKDGDEGVGFFKSFVFRRTNTKLTKNDRPTGGSYNAPLPKETYWTDGIPSGTEMVWMSSRIFSADGDAPQQDEWSVPAQMTDTADFDVEFSSSVSPAAPKNHPNTTPGWSNTSDETTIWMATSTCSNGVWSEWQVSKIKGEAGDPGTSINIQGSYDSYSALLAAKNAGTLKGNNPPLQGDCYVINGDLYVWDGDEFINCGNIKGDPGDPGAGIQSITYKYGVSSSSTVVPTEWYSNSPATNDTNRKYLWKQTYMKFTNVTDSGTDDLVFEEVIGVHGDKGIDGESTEYIYLLSNEEDPSKINVPTSNNPIDTNSRGSWSDDPQGTGEDYKYEYVSEHIKYYDSVSEQMVWGPYSKASLWSTYAKDGRGINYVESEFAVHSKISDTISTLQSLSWLDSSPAVTESKPYLWKRTKTFFTDGTSSVYSYECIGKKGDNGIDGESVQYAYKLTTSNTPPNPPSTDVEGSNIVGSWTDDPQLLGNYDSDGEWIGDGTGQEIAVTYKYQWVSERVKKDGSWLNWSSATLWSELYPGTYLHIKYSNDIENKIFTSNNGEDVGKYIGVLIDYNQGDSADFDDYTWKKFEGNDGFGREYIFKLNNDYNNPPTVPMRAEDHNKPQSVPATWEANPITPTPNNRYCWCCHRDGNGNEWGDWTGNSTNTSKAYLFSMYAESVKGETGERGPILYPAGYWESGKTYTQTLEGGIPTAVPYVYNTYDESYYYLKSSSVSSSVRPSSDSTNWAKMSTYNAIYTDILLANNAKVGQAVFNGNFMFSQNGINASGDKTTGTEYTKFNHSTPYASTNEFRPAWCVNLVTGAQWMSCGRCYYAADGSGYVADGNIAWNASGNITKFPQQRIVTGSISAQCPGATYTHIMASVTLSNWSSTDSVQVMFIDLENNVSTSKTVTPAALTTVGATRPDNTDVLQKKWSELCTVRLYVNNKIIAESPVQRISGNVTPVPPTEYTLTIDTNGLSGVCLHNTATRTPGSAGGYFVEPADEDGIAKITWNNTTGLLVNGSTPGTSVSLHAGDTVYFYNDNASSTSPVTNTTLRSMDQSVNF